MVGVFFLVTRSFVGGKRIWHEREQFIPEFQLTTQQFIPLVFQVSLGWFMINNQQWFFCHTYPPGNEHIRTYPFWKILSSRWCSGLLSAPFGFGYYIMCQDGLPAVKVEDSEFQLKGPGRWPVWLVHKGSWWGLSCWLSLGTPDPQVILGIFI